MGLSWQQGPLAAQPRRPVPDPRSAARAAAVRRTAAPADAGPVRRRLDRRQRGRRAAARAGPLPGGVLPAAPTSRPACWSRPTASPHHRDLGPHRLVHRPARRPGTRRAGRLAVRRPAGLRDELRDRVAFAWRPMDAFYEEDERILGHAADPYHRIDIRRTSRHLVVRDGDRVVADTQRPRRALRVRLRAALVRAARRRRPRPRWPRSTGRPSARTRAWPATTTSAGAPGPPGPTRRRGPRSTGSRRPGLVRARQDRRLPRRQAAGARTRPDRRAARHRPRPRRRRDPAATT